MSFQRAFIIPAALLMCIYSGCSNSGTDLNPVEPDISGEHGLTIDNDNNGQTCLWGYYDIEIDPVTWDTAVTPLRHAMFTANVVNFLNANPAFLGLSINKVQNDASYIDLDVDISITHPFPGLPQFNGYDVRGIFMSEGSQTLQTNSDLIIPAIGTDPYMLIDPHDYDGGGPDGYTRWFNPTEFNQDITHSQLLGYVEGKLATHDYTPGATLNPYKYFADDLVMDEDLWSWLTVNPGYEGRFSSGNTATRNYYIRFPKPGGIKFGYAVVANWIDADTHPANAPEAVASSVVITHDLHYIDDTDWGGDLILDISIFDWHSEVESGVMEDYVIRVESTVLDSSYCLNSAEMTPVDGDENYSTYHVEIPADHIYSNDGNEYFVLVEYPDHDYQNDFGVPNLAYTDPLTTIFRSNLFISPDPFNYAPVCDLLIDPSTPMPAEGWDVGVPVQFDATGTYDDDGDDLTYEWDFDGDGIYDEDPDDSYTGSDDYPLHTYTESYTGTVWLRVTDTDDADAVCSVEVDVTAWPSKNIPLRDGVDALDMGIDDLTGDLYILYGDWLTWVYPLDEYYHSGYMNYSMPADFYPEFMDIVSTCHMVCGGGTRYKVFDPDGNQTSSAILDGGPVRDVASFTSQTGTYADTLAILLGTTKYPDPPDEPYVRHYLHLIQPPDYVYDYYTSWCGYNYDVSSGNTGIDKTYYEWIVAIDTDTDGESIWVLEQPDFYCTNWYKDSWFMKFSGRYFGDGTDSSWTDARDMSRDDGNRFHILDYDSDSPLIRVYTGDVSGGDYIGSYGDSETISGDPQRIDGNDFDGNILVLHGSGGDTFMLSVFLPEEMP